MRSSAHPRAFLCPGLAAAALVAAPAGAGPIEEVRLGVMAHNTCLGLITCDNAHKEDGVNVAGELVFASPDFLDWALAPRPYVMASLNTAGETSYGGGGLQWSWRFADDWSLEPGIGYVIHSNDDLDNPYPPNDPRRGPFQESTLLLGSRDLARLSLAVTHEVTPSWGVQVIAEHLSHGQILGHGRNQGMDEVGVRVTYRLGAAERGRSDRR